MSAPSQRDPSRVYYKAGGFEQSRPILTGADAKETFDSIPVIDFSDIFSPSLEARRALAHKVGHATRHVGFFYAANAPVSHDKIDQAFAVVDQFFSQPDEAKLQIDCTKSRSAKGYQPRQTVGPNGVVRDSFAMGNDFTDPEQQHISVAPEGSLPLNLWPDATLPEFRRAVYEYFHEVYPFALKLIQIFALALDLPETALDQYFRCPLADITAQHYPAQTSASSSSSPSEPMELLFPHADFGSVTLLLQNAIAGLEVLNANGIWIPAPPKPYTFVVNTGNYVEAWTNGRWPATVHRVFARVNRPRYSIAFFLAPSTDVVLSPLRELLDEGEVPQYPAQNIGQRQVKGIFASRPEHPIVPFLNAVPEEEWRYEHLSSPELFV